MGRLGVTLDILNQKGTPAFYSDIFANRPSAGFAGRVFISTDTGAIYEDTGSTWTLIADAGAGSSNTLEVVTTNGNTTTKGIVISAGNLAIGTSTAGAPLDIHTTTGTAAQFNGTTTNNAFAFFQNAGTSKWRIGNLYNAGANSFQVYDVLSATARLTILNNGDTTINGNLIGANAQFSGGVSTTDLRYFGSGIVTFDVSNLGTQNFSIRNGALTTLLTLSNSGTLTTNGFIKSGGTSSQFLKADGSVDSTAYGTGTVTSVAALTLGTTGTDLSSSVATGTTTPVITLNVPDASATARGVITTGTQTIAGVKTFSSYVNLLSSGVDGTYVDILVGLYSANLTEKNTISTSVSSIASNSGFKFNASNGGGGATTTTVLTLTRGGATFSTNVTASSLIKSGGTSSQFLKADGSVDSTSYQGALTLTTTGTSGAATLVGNTLNIPQYSGGGGMAIGGSITSATAGSILFAGTSGVLAQNNANFFWDNTNNRLGISTNSPQRQLELYNSSGDPNACFFRPTNSSSFGLGRFYWEGYSGTTTRTTYSFFQSQTNNTGTSTYSADLTFFNSVNGTLAERCRFTATGNFLIGSTSDSNQGVLQVSGGITASGISLTGEVLTVSATLNKSYYHVFTGSTGQTLTLPSPSSNNYIYVIINNTVNSVTIAAASSTTITTTTGTSVASITLIANARTEIIADGSTKYYQIY